MEITQRTDKEHIDVLNIAISGDLDASSAIQVDQVIRAALDRDQCRLLLDFNELDYISSAGLGVFVSYIDELKEKNGCFAPFGMKAEVYDVFKLLGLDKILQIFTTEKEAKQYVHEKN